VLASATVLTLLFACTPAQVRYASVAAPMPPAAPRATLFLVGDAGEINPHSTAVLDHLRENISSAVSQGPGPVVVAFLGDNLYELGASADNADDLAILEAQVAALGTHARVQGVFIPGNHDWSHGGADELGRRAVRLQEDWISRLGATHNVRLLPADACPGPATLDVDASLHLVFVDTEWLLRQPADDCGGVDDFFDRLEDDLAANRAKQVVVLSHHPLASGGPHAGHIAPFERGPFLYYLLKKSGVSVQDLASRRYSTMIRRFEEAFAASGVQPLFQASGHDHSLQVIRLAGAGQPAYQLVSGAGSRSTNSRRIEGTRYATNGYGYMRVDFHDSGPRATVYVRPLEGGDVRAAFTCPLASAQLSDTCAEAPMAAGAR
jgi:hypothetical protein